MLNHSKIDEGSTLLATPPLARLHRHVRDLITIAYERSTRIPSKSLCLTKLEYVSDEKLDGKCSMHFVAQVREAGHADAIPVSLTITAEYET